MALKYLGYADLKNIRLSDYLEQIRDLVPGNDLSALDEDESCIFEDAMQFKQGCCNIFAIALKEIFPEYEIKILHGLNKAVHIYCKHKDYYIDVSGSIKNDLSFRYSLCGDYPSVANEETYDPAEDSTEPYYEYRLAFAKALILSAGYKHLYRVD